MSGRALRRRWTARNVPKGGGRSQPRRASLLARILQLCVRVSRWWQGPPRAGPAVDSPTSLQALLLRDSGVLPRRAGRMRPPRRTASRALTWYQKLFFYFGLPQLES